MFGATGAALVAYWWSLVCWVHCHELVHVRVAWVQLGCTEECMGHGQGQRWAVGHIGMGWDTYGRAKGCLNA